MVAKAKGKSRAKAMPKSKAKAKPKLRAKAMPKGKRKKSSTGRKTVKGKAGPRLLSNKGGRKATPARAGIAPQSGVDARIELLEDEIRKHKKALTGRKMVAPVSVVSASDIRKDVNFFERSFVQAEDVYSLSFYFVSALVCIGVLSLLFGSLDTFIFYSVFGLFLWWWTHRFHISRLHILKPFLSLGSLAVFLYLFYIALGDMLSLLVCVMYSLSFVVAGVLYLYHTKNDFRGELYRSFPRTFLVMFYAHIMALTGASIIGYALPPLLLGDSFVSIMFLLLAWLFPSLLVYFFFTKFLYLRFFDRVHIKRDALKGLAHGAGYAGVFTALMILVYLLSAIQLVMVERDTYDATFEHGVMILSESKLEIYSAFGEDFISFGVAKDAVGLIDDTVDGMDQAKGNIQDVFTLGDYIYDGYFTKLAMNRRVARSFAGTAASVAEVGDDVAREYGRMRENIALGVFEDGTTGLEDHEKVLDAYLSAYYVPYSEPERFRSLRERLEGGQDSYSALFGDGMVVDFNMAYHPDMAVLRSGDSRFSKRFHWMLYHTRVFRDLMLFVLDSVLHEVEEVIEPSAVRMLYGDGSEGYLPDDVLRKRVIKSNFDATMSLIG